VKRWRRVIFLQRRVKPRNLAVGFHGCSCQSH